MNRSRERGFTLIEMIVVVTIITILAAVAIPRYAESLRASTEGYTRGSLGTLRKALSVYYSDMDGQYPADLTALTQSGRYVRRIPKAKIPGAHPESSAVLLAAAPNDGGGWYYDNDPGSQTFGALRINCTHTALNGTVWTNY